MTADYELEQAEWFRLLVDRALAGRKAPVEWEEAIAIEGAPKAVPVQGGHHPDCTCKACMATAIAALPTADELARLGSTGSAPADTKRTRSRR